LETLAKEKHLEIEVRDYLKEPPSPGELKQVLEMLGVSPHEVLRKQEKIWKEQFKGKDLTAEELIKIMAENPKLIERPVVIYENKAVLGRPAENIKKLFE
jgi:arsenate reductase